MKPAAGFSCKTIIMEIIKRLSIHSPSIINYRKEPLNVNKKALVLLQCCFTNTTQISGMLVTLLDFNVETGRKNVSKPFTSLWEFFVRYSL